MKLYKVKDKRYARPIFMTSVEFNKYLGFHWDEKANGISWEEWGKSDDDTEEGRLIRKKMERYSE